MKSAVLALCAVSLTVVAALALSSNTASRSGSIAVDRARATVMTPENPVSFGYMTIRNTSGQKDRLISVSTEFAAVSEVHENFTDDGLDLMRRLPDGVEIPAGGQTELNAEGVHLMFMQMIHCLSEGSQTKLVLEFEKAGRMEVDMRIAGDGSTSTHDHH